MIRPARHLGAVFADRKAEALHLARQARRDDRAGHQPPPKEITVNISISWRPCAGGCGRLVRQDPGQPPQFCGECAAEPEPKPDHEEETDRAET